MSASSESQSNLSHPAFELKGESYIESLDLTVEEYWHRKTGLKHYHLAANNDENVFLVALKTVPTDSTGVAHILEHTALCGSEKYPVRDPFFMMLRRSINTFMNAFTSSDWTAYPFASQNRTDFNNLLDVYLDAVFFSRISELDFLQEGHRLEFEEMENADSELTFKGVVYNEMKGAMSAESSILYHTICKYLFPTTTYHYNSGGDPEEIPNLNYEELKTFYKKHYHPSNAIIFTFGNIKANEHQQVFENNVLKRFEASDELPEIDLEKRLREPLQIQESYAAGDAADPDSLKNKTHITLSWLLGESSDLETSLKAQLLSSVLLDNSASPLRHALETSDLGLAPSAMCGLEDSNREMSFSCGLEGSEIEHTDKVEQLILDTLRSVKEKGVDQEQVEAVLHQLELSQREIGGDRYPYGMQLVLAALSPALHGAEVASALNIDETLDILKTEIQSPSFIPDLIDELLLQNKHRVRLVLSPDSELTEKRTKEEKRKLEKIRKSLSVEEKEKIIENSRALQLRQDTPEDEEILPKVTRADVPKLLSYPQEIVQEDSKIPLSVFNEGTNGLIYQQIICPLPDFDDQEIALLPLFCRLIVELGVGEESYLEAQIKQSKVSGGIGAFYAIKNLDNDDNVENLRGHFVLSGKALVRNYKENNALLFDTFQNVRFDEQDRVLELLSQIRVAKEQSVTSNGHALAMMAASSGMSKTARLSHLFSGLASIQFIKSLDENVNEDKSEIARQELLETLKRIHSKIIQMPRQFLLISDKDSNESASKELQKVWSRKDDSTSINQNLVLPNEYNLENQEKRLEAWLCNSQVNFCAKSYPTVGFSHPDAPALTVLGGFLRNGILHKTIREQGGAYGGGASFDAGNKCFRFYSYRDPRIEGTLNDFDEAVQWMLTTEHSEQKLEEAILGVVSDIDKPGSPAGSAKQCFHSNLYERSPEVRQAFRKKILEVTLEDLVNVCRLYLDSEKASIAVVSDNTKKEELENLGLEIFSL